MKEINNNSTLNSTINESTDKLINESIREQLNNDNQINLNDNQQSKTKSIDNLLCKDKWIFKFEWNVRDDLIKLLGEYTKLLFTNKEILSGKKESIKKNKNDLIKLLNESPLKLDEESHFYEICINLDFNFKDQIINQLIKNENLIIYCKNKINTNLKSKLIEENNHLIHQIINLPVGHLNDVNLVNGQLKSSQSKDEKSKTEFSNLQNDKFDDLKEEINKLKRKLDDEITKNKKIKIQSNQNNCIKIITHDDDHHHSSSDISFSSQLNEPHNNETQSNEEDNLSNNKEKADDARLPLNIVDYSLDDDFNIFGENVSLDQIEQLDNKENTQSTEIIAHYHQLSSDNSFDNQLNSDNNFCHQINEPHNKETQSNEEENLSNNNEQTDDVRLPLNIVNYSLNDDFDTFRENTPLDQIEAEQLDDKENRDCINVIKNNRLPLNIVNYSLNDDSTIFGENVSLDQIEQLDNKENTQPTEIITHDDHNSSSDICFGNQLNEPHNKETQSNEKDNLSNNKEKTDDAKLPLNIVNYSLDDDFDTFRENASLDRIEDQQSQLNQNNSIERYFVKKDMKNKENTTHDDDHHSSRDICFGNQLNEPHINETQSNEEDNLSNNYYNNEETDAVRLPLSDNFDTFRENASLNQIEAELVHKENGNNCININITDQMIKEAKSKLIRIDKFSSKLIKRKPQLLYLSIYLNQFYRTVIKKKDNKIMLPKYQKKISSEDLRKQLPKKINHLSINLTTRDVGRVVCFTFKDVIKKQIGIDKELRCFYLYLCRVDDLDDVNNTDNSSDDTQLTEIITHDDDHHSSIDISFSSQLNEPHNNETQSNEEYNLNNNKEKTDDARLPLNIVNYSLNDDFDTFRENASLDQIEDEQNHLNKNNSIERYFVKKNMKNIEISTRYHQLSSFDNQLNEPYNKEVNSQSNEEDNLSNNNEQTDDSRLSLNIENNSLDNDFDIFGENLSLDQIEDEQLDDKENSNKCININITNQMIKAAKSKLIGTNKFSFELIKMKPELLYLSIYLNQFYRSVIKKKGNKIMPPLYQKKIACEDLRKKLPKKINHFPINLTTRDVGKVVKSTFVEVIRKQIRIGHELKSCYLYLCRVDDLDDSNNTDYSSDDTQSMEIITRYHQLSSDISFSNQLNEPHNKEAQSNEEDNLSNNSEQTDGVRLSLNIENNLLNDEFDTFRENVSLDQIEDEQLDDKENSNNCININITNQMIKEAKSKLIGINKYSSEFIEMKPQLLYLSIYLKQFYRSVIKKKGNKIMLPKYQKKIACEDLRKQLPKKINHLSINLTTRDVRRVVCFTFEDVLNKQIGIDYEIRHYYLYLCRIYDLDDVNNTDNSADDTQLTEIDF